MSYYNTTHLPPAQKARATTKAKKQDAAIYAMFVQAGEPLSPSQVHTRTGGQWPITSVRRAITNLTEARQLVKTSLQVQGPYGRPEYLWEVADRATYRVGSFYVEPKQYSSVVAWRVMQDGRVLRTFYSEADAKADADKRAAKAAQGSLF